MVFLSCMMILRWIIRETIGRFILRQKQHMYVDFAEVLTYNYITK